MKDCIEYAALLDAFLDGELSPEEMERVQAHLDGCPACRAYVDDGLALRAAFPQAEEQEVPAGFAEGVMEAVRAMPRDTPFQAEKRKRTVWFRFLAPLAACFAVVLVLRYAGSGGGMSSVSVRNTAGADTSAPTSAASSQESAPAESEPYSYAAYAGDSPADMDHAAPDGGSPAETPTAPVEDMLMAAPESATEEETALGEKERHETTKLLESGLWVEIPAEQSDLLEEYPTRTDESGRVWYCLTGGEYQELIAALEAGGVTPGLSAGDVQSGDTVLVGLLEA